MCKIELEYLDLLINSSRLEIKYWDAFPLTFQSQNLVVRRDLITLQDTLGVSLFRKFSGNTAHPRFIDKVIYCNDYWMLLAERERVWSSQWFFILLFKAADRAITQCSDRNMSIDSLVPRESVRIRCVCLCIYGYMRHITIYVHIASYSSRAFLPGFSSQEE